jgi:peptidyl-prolyl isomerase G (cyclophilin G)
LHSPDEASAQQHEKRLKHKKHPSLTQEHGKASDHGDNARVAETEEEYDTRLEREENERHQAERRRELARIRKRYESAAQSMDGVRFKGRGRMKYIDPEIRRHG